VNKRSKGGFVRFNTTILAILTTLLLVSSGASAKGHKVKASDGQSKVVAHLSFGELSAVDMAIQKKVDDKYYLYVQHSKEQGISVIDISKPALPKAIGIIPWPDTAVSSRMNLTGDLAVIAESGVPRRSSSDDDLVLWDLSNPAAPRVVQKFSRVVKWLQDERDFIYVLNSDGLWVISKPADRAPGQSESSSSYGG